MSEQEQKSMEVFAKVLPQLSDFDKGKLIGIGEGLAMQVEQKAQA